MGVILDTVCSWLFYATGGLSSLVAPFLGSLWDLVNSNFTAALAGAGVGAYTAQWIAEKSERRRALLTEARATNAAIMLAFATTNAYCTLKSQQVHNLVDEYKKLVTQVSALQASGPKSGSGSSMFTFQADLKNVNVPATQVDTLKQLIFEKISLTGRALVTFSTLTQAIAGLNQCVEMRNEIVSNLNARSPVPQKELIPLYLGLPDAQGHIDERYKNCIDGIASNTDDCIFFSKSLMDDLVRHGKALSVRLARHAPRVPEPDFSKAIAEGIIPPNSQYEAWLAGFRERAVPAPASTWVDFWNAADWG